MTDILTIATILGGIAAIPYLWGLVRRGRLERKARRVADEELALGERVLAEMHRAQARNPAPLLFPSERLAVVLDVKPSTLLPVLNRLVRDSQVFHDPRSGGYSLEPMPWNRPGGHRLFG